ncbi:CocE/NonD family hydrolase [Agrobacterium tumefaciens]|nr:CocE/NonD family hydrolase [Agrobacterium tumefaciens]UXT00396.1 CocE/NonD family hydrolase [Agrobacterium tumefaciens]
MQTTKWTTSPRQYEIVEERNAKINLSDGTVLDGDVFRPASAGKFPAILGIHCYNKDLQSAPIGPNAINMANGGIEAGDYNFYVRRGYVQVIVNVRGSGESEGDYLNYGPREVQDTAEVIEWIAAQPWCDGNVGMFGVSYFAVAQQQVAALKPPHLKALFCPFGYTDFYRDKFYHGGILSHQFMQGWSRIIDNVRAKSSYLERHGEEQFRAAIGVALKNRDIAAVPYLLDALKNPDKGANSLIVDILLNSLDGDYYQERNVDYSKDLTIPAYHGGCWGIYGLHLPGAFRSWEHWNGPKKLTIGPPVYLDRPVYQYQYESLRWFDHWLKGIDTGMLDEPPVKVFIAGTGEWKTSTEWPLPETRWTPFYLHSGGLLSEHEFWPNEGSSTFEDSHFTRGSLTFTSPPLVENTEIVGPIALNIHASTTDTDIHWFASLLHIDAEGKETLLTRGWLKGSHRKLDAGKSKPWLPVHVHTEEEPLTPNEVYEFNIEIRPYGILLKAGERIAVRIKGVDDEQPANSLHAFATGHLWRQHSSRVTVHHDAKHPSHLLLPITKGNLLETYISGGNLSSEYFPYRVF